MSLLTILEIVRVDLDVFAPLLRNFVLGEDGVDGARINASAAVDALIGIDEIHGRGVVGVNTVHGADLYARGIFHPDAGLNDDISHVPQGYHAPVMPESEPKPKLIELVAPGAGQGWKATLRNGKAVVIHEIAAPAAEAAAAVPRIQRLAEHRHPALSPLLAWGTDPNGIWVAVEPNEGTPLGQILSRGPLTPPAAAALGAAVLSGVAALHEAGIAMGGFGASAVRITSNGDVRLAGHPAAAVRGAPSQSDLRADVRSCGMAVCAAFGVDPAGAPAPPSIPPGLVVTMRSMASGAMGPAADRAQGALREMASALLAPDRATASQAELALRAGGREMPAITPFLPKETFPPGAAPAQQQPPGLAPWGAPASAPSSPPAPATFGPPQRDQTPVRSPASYDAPPRPMETYPPAPARSEERRVGK